MYYSLKYTQISKNGILKVPNHTGLHEIVAKSLPFSPCSANHVFNQFDNSLFLTCRFDSKVYENKFKLVDMIDPTAENLVPGELFSLQFYYGYENPTQYVLPQKDALYFVSSSYGMGDSVLRFDGSNQYKKLNQKITQPNQKVVLQLNNIVLRNFYISGKSQQLTFCFSTHTEKRCFERFLEGPQGTIEAPVPAQLPYLVCISGNQGEICRIFAQQSNDQFEFGNGAPVLSFVAVGVFGVVFAVVVGMLVRKMGK